MATKQKTGETVTDAMEKLQAAGLGSVNKMGSVWLKDMAALNSEVLGFVADRIREDIRTQQEIMPGEIRPHCYRTVYRRDRQTGRAWIAHAGSCGRRVEAYRGRGSDKGHLTALAWHGLADRQQLIYGLPGAQRRAFGGNRGAGGCDAPAQGLGQIGTARQLQRHRANKRVSRPDLAGHGHAGGRAEPTFVMAHDERSGSAPAADDHVGNPILQEAAGKGDPIAKFGQDMSRGLFRFRLIHAQQVRRVAGAPPEIPTQPPSAIAE